MTRIKWGTAHQIVAAAVAAPDDGRCIDWPGSVSSAAGYGTIWHGNTLRLVGHVVLEDSGRPRPTPQHHQLHSCDRPSCISPWHLRWGTNDENRAESVERERQAKGEGHGNAKLTDALVQELRAGGDVAAIAARAGVTLKCALKARSGRSWRHVKAGT